MSEQATATIFTLWGFEFEWRESGSYPLQWRRAGGCAHDWVCARFDSPLLAAVRASMADSLPVTDSRSEAHP